MKKQKTNKGITLIALIITIIVLLILAAVAITAIKGDGIISHAKNAKKIYQEEENREDSVISGYEQLLAEETGDWKNAMKIHYANAKHLKADTKIPEGAKWKKGSTVLNSGEDFPKTGTDIEDETLIETEQYRYEYNKLNKCWKIRPIDSKRTYYTEEIFESLAGIKINKINNIYVFCENMTGPVYIQENIDVISYAFQSCKNLKSVYVHKNVSNVTRTFADCPNLQNIYVDMTEAKFCSLTNVSGAFYEARGACVVHFTDGERTVMDLAKKYNWKDAGSGKFTADTLV